MTKEQKSYPQLQSRERERVKWNSKLIFIMETKSNVEMLTQSEQESKELTLEQQAQIYADMWKNEIFKPAGIFKHAEPNITAESILQRAQELQAEMSEEDRKDLTMLIYLPAGLHIEDAWKAIPYSKRKISDPNLLFEYVRGKASKVEVGSIVAFSHYNQEPDVNSLGRSARSANQWEETNQEFMSPLLRVAADAFYEKAHGKPLDSENITMCPSYKETDRPRVNIFGKKVNESGPRTIAFGFNHGQRDKHEFGTTLYRVKPEAIDSKVGVRRVVSKEF
jgi:hypothetical protein